MSERVLVLGAGASLGARAGLGVRTNDEPLPPLGRGLARYLLRWLRANDPKWKLRPFMDGYHYPSSGTCPHYTGNDLWLNKHLGAVAAALSEVAVQDEGAYDGAATPFEVLMDAWSDREHGRRLLRATQLLITYALNWGYRCAFAEGPDRYDDLLARFQATMVVTVNYDTLVEEAIVRGSMRYSYPGLDGPRATPGPSIEQVRGGETGAVVPIFKLHGSANWVPVSGVGASADEQVAEQTARERPTHFVRSGPHLVAQTWASYAPPNRVSLLHELEESPVIGNPIVAVYGTGKYLLDNPVHVQEHRDMCLARLRDAAIARVLAIGIRPVSKDDDPVMWDLMDLLGKIAGERTYVSPTPEECEEMRARGFHSLRSTLADFLSQSSPGRVG